MACYIYPASHGIVWVNIQSALWQRLMVYYICLASQRCPSGILIHISSQFCASPGNIIIYLASLPRLFGDITWANPQTPLPHWVFGKLFWCPFSLNHCRPYLGTSRQTNLHCSTPTLYLCYPSLGSQGKNRTALGPIFFSFHTPFVLLSQHSLQPFCQACSFGCKHNASSLPLGKMLPCFDLISGSSRLLLLFMLVMHFLWHRVINSHCVLSDAQSPEWWAMLWPRMIQL